MNKLTAFKEDICFWTGFYPDEDCLSWASNKAYLDMNRTMTFKDIPQNDTQAEKSRVDAQRKKWRDEGTGVIRYHVCRINGDFTTWHKKVCGKLIDIYGEDKLVIREKNKRTNNPAKLTYGQAQKWLNMTLKYLWLLNRLGWVDDSKISTFVCKYQESFHVPLDSYILRYVAKQDKSREEKFSTQQPALDCNVDFRCFWKSFGSAWSQMKDADQYYQYQEALAQAITDQTPLEWELVHWHRALKYYG